MPWRQLLLKPVVTFWLLGVATNAKAPDKNWGFLVVTSTSGAGPNSIERAKLVSHESIYIERMNRPISELSQNSRFRRDFKPGLGKASTCLSGMSRQSLDVPFSSSRTRESQSIRSSGLLLLLISYFFSLRLVSSMRFA